MKAVLACFVLALGIVSHASVVGREAFTFTAYDLQLQVEPAQHRLAVRGRVRLRNDSNDAQKALALQISSSLTWHSIRLNGKSVDFDSHPYASDIDHTGALTEAIVALPEAAPPGTTLELEVAYDGVIVRDGTRLARVGIPEKTALHSDWDEIDKDFSAVRGIGFVAWYPLAVEAASLSDGDSVEKAIDRWKKKEVGAEYKLDFNAVEGYEVNTSASAIPTFVLGHFERFGSDSKSLVLFGPGQSFAANVYDDAFATLPSMPLVGGATGAVKLIALRDSDDLPFATDGMILSPLKSPITNDALLNLVYAKALASTSSPQAWVKDGLAHFAQILFVEQEGNREAAAAYLKTHVSALIEAEKHPDDSRALVSSPDNLFLQSKAMCVWWMLRDLLNADPRLSLAAYDAKSDHDIKTIQRVIENSTHRDLGWFFDDWVYHDHDLPDFRVSYVNVSSDKRAGYLVTVTVENTGDAGAEVPISVATPSGSVSRRMEVRGRSTSTLRLQTAAYPTSVTVNDDSVPESDTGNDTYQIPSK